MTHKLFLGFSLSIAVAFALMAASAPYAHAGACFSQPVVHMDGTATVNSGVFVRDAACQDGTSVVATLSAGEVVNVHALDDGWYEVSRTDGTRGWVWGSFITVNANPTGVTEAPAQPKEHDKHEKKEEVHEKEEVHVKDTSLVERMKGRILLQVEDLGKAHYVHPDTGERYYMDTGETAYEMLRAFGLGITNADLDQIPIVGDEDEMLASSSVCGSNALAARLSGKILLKVQDVGQAYYIHPDKCRAIYMKDGGAAYQIMRKLSLGITNKDIAGVPAREFVPIDGGSVDKVEEKEEEKEVVVETPSNVNTADIRVSTFQVGEIPSNVDIVALNEYWLEDINELRAERGLRQLVLDQRWVDTASEYAAQMGINQWYAHERDGGLSMHDWIDTKGLDFTVRYSPDGWNDNYYTENISWGMTDNSQSGVEGVLDYSKDFYLSEVDWNGPHYRTIYHEDWNSVGLGFYFEPQGSGSYKVYVAMHYGSLEL